MSWLLADSITTLRDEVDQAAPNRSTLSDGTIGDAAHATRDSDHNPWLNNTVRAVDITHDPDNGCDADVLAREVSALLGKHPALGDGAYVIRNSRIISTDRLSEGWRPYSGSNPHDKHVHVSVGESNYNSTARWGVLDQEDDMADAATKAQLDRIEKLGKQAVNKLNNNVDRLQKVAKALEALEVSVSDDATKAQVRRVIELVKAPEGDA